MKKSLLLAMTLAAMVALIYACSKNTNKTEGISLDKTPHLLAVSDNPPKLIYIVFRLKVKGRIRV